MDTSRRTLLSLGALLGGVTAFPGLAAVTDPPPGLLSVLHVYADEAGMTHARRVAVHGNKALPVVAVQAGSIGPGVSRWGSAPTRRFSINITGDIEVELTDGTRHRIGKGDLVFIDDVGSQGHRSHMLTPIANLFLIVEDDFDLQAWAGEAA